MHRRGAHRTAVVGIVLAAVGLVGAVVFQVQPWRTCTDDTSPAACPMLPADYDAFLVFVLVLLAGCIGLVVSFVLRLAGPRAPFEHRPPAEDRSD